MTPPACEIIDPRGGPTNQQEAQKAIDDRYVRALALGQLIEHRSEMDAPSQTATRYYAMSRRFNGAGGWVTASEARVEFSADVEAHEARQAGISGRAVLEIVAEAA